MLLVGYCFVIRSERRLCEEVHLNLAYRWFCRLALDGAVPDHSTFSKNRHGRFRDSDLLREVFETTVRRCVTSRRQPPARRAGQRGPAARVGQPCCTRVSRRARRCRVRRGSAGRAEVHLASRPGVALDGGERRPGLLRLLHHYLIDLKHAVIMDVEATTAVRQAEVTAQRRMIERTEALFDLWPERLAADAGYGSAENLAWLVHERGIEPHIPVFDKSARSDGCFARSDCAYDHKRDRYICPGGRR
jgi:hypothetical protein